MLQFLEEESALQELADGSCIPKCNQITLAINPLKHFDYNAYCLLYLCEHTTQGVLTRFIGVLEQTDIIFPNSINQISFIMRLIVFSVMYELRFKSSSR